MGGVLAVKDIRRLAGSLAREAFRQQLGPFVLIRRPPSAGLKGTDPMGLPLNVAVTQMSKPESMSFGALSLLFEFEDLGVVTLPPLTGHDEISVGRQPDCDVVLDDASVSKRHAIIRWDVDQGSCSIEDLGSTNGTILNASTMIRRQTPLRDGDILSFGDVQFWFLLSDTLHSKLSTSSGSAKLISHSG